jgi:hypothetical protein
MIFLSDKTKARFTPPTPKITAPAQSAAIPLLGKAANANAHAIKSGS